MRELGRVHMARGAFLQGVVADHRGGVQRLLDVAALQLAEFLVAEIGPDARIAIGLKLQPDGQAIGFNLRAGGLAGAVDLGIVPSAFCTWWATSCAIT